MVVEVAKILIVYSLVGCGGWKAPGMGDACFQASEPRSTTASLRKTRTPTAMPTPYDPHDDLEARIDAMALAFTRLEARTAQLLSLLLDAPGLLARTAQAEEGYLDAGYKSRDHVQLSGCDLRINGRSVGLSKRQAVLMALLMRHAIHGDSGFLTTMRIIAEIERDFSGLWSMPVPEDIHEVVFKVRKKLGLDRDLLESAAAKGGGLRISTPRANIVPLKSPWTDDSNPESPR